MLPKRIINLYDNMSNRIFKILSVNDWQINGNSVSNLDAGFLFKLSSCSVPK